MNIQWYPGHMTKTRRMMEENIKLCDVVIELLDARIPMSSKNPDIDVIARNKRRIVVLNKSDLADPQVTALWKNFFENQGHRVITADSVSGKGLNEIAVLSRELMKDKIESLRRRGRINVPIRAMITGIPNVGKSTLINKFTGGSPTKTGDKPGVTKGKQWIKIKKDFDILDTPGILWPKFEDEAVGLRLAFTGSINDDIIDTYTLALKLIGALSEIKPDCLGVRYGINRSPEDSPETLLQKIGEARGFKIKGGEVDVSRAAAILLDEFRGGRLGRISLENPPDVKKEI